MRNVCKKLQLAAFVLGIVLAAHLQAEDRDPWLWPFTTDSIWNTPIGSKAIFKPASLRPATHVGVDIQILLRTSNDDPERQVLDSPTWGPGRDTGKKSLGFSLRVPDDWTVPDAGKDNPYGLTPNANFAILLPDGDSIMQGCKICRTAKGGPIYMPDWMRFPGNRKTVSIQSDGMEGGGQGASGMSSLGGTIRLGELVGKQPIRHVIKINPFAARYCYYSKDIPGWRWPAKHADSYAPEQYKGQNPDVVMGSLLAIKPDVTPEKLALKTIPGRKLFFTLQNYGAYFTEDAAWDTWDLIVERDAELEFERAYGFSMRSNTWLDEINRLMQALHVVVNNSPSSKGGGGKPRQPAAPQFTKTSSTRPVSASRITKTAPAESAEKPTPEFGIAIKNGSMTEGDRIPSAWDGKFGEAEITRDTKVFKEGPASLCVAVTGGKSGMGFQSFSHKGSGKIRIAGWVKSEGNVKVNVAVQAFAPNYTKNQFMQVKYLQNSIDWSDFDGEVTLPDWTDSFNILLLAEGNGKAWLDEVRIPGSAVTKNTASTDLTIVSPPAKDKPWKPGWGFYREFPAAWKSMHLNNLARTRKGDINIVFYGDSITQGWGGAGREVWQKYYEKLKAVNYGIGGDTTRQLLYRIDGGELDNILPRVVVLMIGTNNLYDDHNSGTDEEIAKGIAAVVAKIREKLPGTRVLLLAILPRQNNYFCERIQKINSITAGLDDGKQVRCLDMGSIFQTSFGKVKQELYNEDQLHLEAGGYELWAKSMAPMLNTMLNGK